MPKHFFLRRLLQVVSIALFSFLVYLLGTGQTTSFWAKIFLRLDPLVGLSLPIACRSLLETLWPVLLVYLSALCFGRIFCGYFCPMGGFLEILGSLVRWGRPIALKTWPSLRFLKYALLALLLIAALLGANLAFWASPLPLTARLYVLCLAPLANISLENFYAYFEHFWPEPLAVTFGLKSLSFAWFIASFWGLLLALEALAPRFWCRYLCPAGALLGLLAKLAPWRRRLEEKLCVQCGKCAKVCPAGLAKPKSSSYSVSECFGCQQCKQACPKGALNFAFGTRAAESSSKLLASRRAFCGTLVGGGLALAGGRVLTWQGTAEAKWLRPPGSVPEEEFLTLCLRCGACIQACPTHGLVPLGLAGGLQALFSPSFKPSRGPCRPECTACGQVCPTWAILPLSFEQKSQAKLGTAQINALSCLALASAKRCLVCHENCPFGAIVVEQKIKQGIAVPSVLAKRCYGCGYCEKYCPTSPPSIKVIPQGALRLSRPDFVKEAKACGLDLRPNRPAEMVLPKDQAVDLNGPPPGFLP